MDDDESVKEEYENDDEFDDIENVFDDIDEM